MGQSSSTSSSSKTTNDIESTSSLSRVSALLKVSKHNSLFIGDDRGSKIKVLFCGKDHFIDGYNNTKKELEGFSQIIVMQSEREMVPNEIVNSHVIVPLMTKITKNMIQHSPKLQLIMQYGTGIEGIDVKAASEAGIYVCKIKSDTSGNAQSCAEHAIYLALAVLRDQKEMTNSLFQSKLGRPTGRTLLNSNILIYGYGSIGKQLAPRLKPFGVNIAAIKRTWKDEDYDDDGKVPYIDEYGTDNDLKKLLRNRDIIFLCCSQNKENMGLINNTFMTHMKRGAIIINIARGGLLNYSDVHEALESGHLGGLGIDVFHTEPFPISDPLLLHPKVIATPHVAGVTVISYNNMAKMVAENVLRMRAGLTPLGCINLQELGIESPPDEN